MIRKQMTDKDYLLYLRNRQKEMRADILKYCIPKRSGDFVAECTLYKKIEQKYHLQRENDKGADVILKGIFQNHVGFLEAHGDLISKKSKNGTRYCTEKKPEQLGLSA